MNTINFRLLEALHRELNIPEEKARKIVEAIEEVVSEKISGKSADYKSIFAEDVLRLEMRLKDDINQSKLDMYKALFL